LAAWGLLAVLAASSPPLAAAEVLGVAEEERGAAAALVLDDGCEEAAAGRIGEGQCGLSLRQLRGQHEVAILANENQTLESEDLQQWQPAHGVRGQSVMGTYHGGGYRNHGGRYIKKLYHQTSPQAGASILRTGFRRGTWHAICGSAIYFSESVGDTDEKAIGGRGYIVEATVDLGRVKHMPRDCDYKMNGGKLASMGYDSITLNRAYYAECKHTASCREYVIYDTRRVLSMRGFTYQGWKHWFSPAVATPDLPAAAQVVVQPINSSAPGQ